MRVVLYEVQVEVHELILGDYKLVRYDKHTRWIFGHLSCTDFDDFWSNRRELVCRGAQWWIRGGDILQNVLPDTILGLQTTPKSTAARALPRTHGGAYCLQYSPRPHSWWGGGVLPSPRTSPPALAYRSSPFPSPPAKASGSAPGDIRFAGLQYYVTRRKVQPV